MSFLYANQVIERCASTNDLAKALGDSGYPHGTWISARVQEGGRGRLGRKWESREGNLFLSMICRIEDRSLWTWVPLATAVGAARAVEKLAEVRIKWPNDLWVHGAKLGGVLCEAVGNSNGTFIVAGIGLNCADSPKGIDQPATSLTESAGGRSVSADEVRQSVISGVLESWRALHEAGPEWVAREYESMAALEPGTEISWDQSSGTVLGLGALGELRVRLPSGEVRSLYAEDVKIRVRRA